MIAQAHTQPASAGVAPAQTTQHRLIGVVMTMFFAFGFCTTLMDTLVPKFKAMFALNYAEVMLTQFSFFGAYFIVSLPAGWLLSRIGYLRSMVCGLLLMAAGAAGFAPAAALGTYPGFLTALFILAAGVTVVQVAANPLAAIAGPADQAPSRLTLAQAFNSVATVAAPQFGRLPDPVAPGRSARGRRPRATGCLPGQPGAGFRAAVRCHRRRAAVAGAGLLAGARLVPAGPGTGQHRLHAPAGPAAPCLRRCLHLHLCRRGGRDRQAPSPTT